LTSTLPFDVDVDFDVAVVDRPRRFRSPSSATSGKATHANCVPVLVHPLPEATTLESF